MKIRIPHLIAYLALLIASQVVFAEAPVVDDKDSLANLQVAKGVFMVMLGDPKMLNVHLGIVRAAHDSIKAQNVKPDFVVVYAGPAVKYLNTAPSEDAQKVAGSVMADIQSKVSKLAEAGVKQEVCSLAAQAFSVDYKTFYPGIKVVGNGFISLIGYQAQGYGLVPID
jgi:intracellular sulfur oxidation DsrE/DsrF family protein